MKLKLYLISQGQNHDYDSFDSAVVCTTSKQSAKYMSPSNGRKIKDWSCDSSWCSGAKHVKVEYLGEAAENLKKGVVCSSFNAG